MRAELSSYNNTTIRVTGTFLDFGWNFYEKKPTVLIRNIRLNGEPVTDHMWITVSDELKEIELDKFDFIEFTTNIEHYQKDNGDEDYAMQSIQEVKVLKKSSFVTDLENIFDFSFIIEDSVTAKKSFGKDEVEIQQELRLPQSLRRISVGENMHVEFHALREDGFEFRFKTDSMHFYSKKLYFNPVKNGQSFVLYGKHKFYIPRDIYRRLKELYFKIYFTKTEYTVPMVFEPRKAFGKKEYLEIMEAVSF